MTSSDDLPVAIVGEGPIGLAAAAHLASRGHPVRVCEAGPTVGANLRDWKLGPFDRVIAATGQRPDLSLTREIRLELDPWLEGARALGAVSLVLPQTGVCPTDHKPADRMVLGPQNCMGGCAGVAA